jgi:hypothetical protein
MSVLIGCDPEIFAKQSGKVVSAHGLIPGDKKNPFKVNKGAVQVDGMALEFNIDPAATDDEFVINIKEVLQQMQLMVPDHEFFISPVAKFSPAYMKQQPKEALELGCDPDFNAWEGGNPFDKPDMKLPMRTASGHVHIGWTNGQDIRDPSHISKCIAVAKQMDYVLGLGSLVYDQDTKRRSMYGKPGCFRPKPYGVEYRTLSNMWLSSETLMRWVFRNAKAGIESLMQGGALFNDGNAEKVRDAINNSNLNQALVIMEKHNLEVPSRV